MPTITELPNHKVIMGGSNVENTVEDKTPIQTDTQPNKNPTTSIACRAIKCTGKVLLGVFTVPTMAVLVSLSGFFAGVADCYYFLLPDVYKRSKICALILSVTIMPPLAIVAGIIYIVAGFFLGISRGVEIADKCSLEPLETTYVNMKISLMGEGGTVE